MSVVIAGAIEIEMIRIPAGQFLMGSQNAFFSEAPPHAVTFNSDFWFGKYPVTCSQWGAVMGTSPSRFAGWTDHPVESITWDDACEFCERLTERAGCHVRLPSEAEWEYACRAGMPSDFFFGPWGPFMDDTAIALEIRHRLCDFAWFDLNSQDSTHPVGLKQANPWGVHDVLGNVWEWCADVWYGDYSMAHADGTPRQEDANNRPRRVVRGGAWDMNAFRCRSSYRSYDFRDAAKSQVGFRIVVDKL